MKWGQFGTLDNLAPQWDEDNTVENKQFGNIIKYVFVSVAHWGYIWPLTIFDHAKMSKDFSVLNDYHVDQVEFDASNSFEIVVSNAETNEAIQFNYNHEVRTENMENI